MKAGSNSFSQPPRILSAAITETSAAPLSSFLASSARIIPGRSVMSASSRRVSGVSIRRRPCSRAQSLPVQPSASGAPVCTSRVSDLGRGPPRGLRRAVAGAVVDQHHPQAPPLAAERRERFADRRRLVARRNQDRDVVEVEMGGIAGGLGFESFPHPPGLPGHEHQDTEPKSRARRREPAPEHRHTIHERGPRAAPGAGLER